MEITPGAPYRDLRDFIAALEAHGKLYRIDRAIDKDRELQPLVRWQYRGGIPEHERRAFLFQNVVNSQGHHYGGSVLVGGLAGSAEIYALGLQCQPEDVADRWNAAMNNPIPPTLVESGPVQEEIHVGDSLLVHDGFLEFPVPVSTPGYDNGAYITAGHWVTKDPDTGQRNVGNYRGLIKGKNLCGLFVGNPQDLAQHWEKCRKAGKPLEVAIVIGAVPALSYTAAQKVPPDMDELALAGGLMGQSIPIVKCQTVDLEVPATAEIVLEGRVSTEYLEEEGPFGESMGYVDLRTLSPFMELTAVTHRRNPIWVSIISQVTPSESSKIKGMSMPTLIQRYLTQRLPHAGVQEVSLMEPLVNLRPYVVVRMAKKTDDDPWDVLNAILDYGDRVGKYVVTVDEDINPHDPVAVTWAITHRSQPHRDVRIVKERPFGATPIGTVLSHPSSRYDTQESSLLIDATRKADFPPVSLPKREYMERAREIWDELGLPPVSAEPPWYGYSLGMWPEDLDAEAASAAHGEHERIGDGLRQTRVKLGPDETLAEARRQWARTHQGRAG
jgi:4-hydroxy-3-polyprenylbenzoate decarboxylase